MKLVFVDSYDSFAYNLVCALQTLGTQVEVVQSDQICPAQLRAQRPDGIVLGPGPGRPEDSGCLIELVQQCSGQIPLLGVCLGHQAIAVAFGGHIARHAVVHGHATAIHHDGSDLFDGLPAAVPMTRYHSLVVDQDHLPDCLRVTAWSEDGAIMGIRHNQHPTWGVQFHPESVLSGQPGLALLKRFTQQSRLESALLATA